MKTFEMIRKRLYLDNLVWQGVGTSTIRTSTGQKFQNVEMVFLVDQNVESQKNTFDVVIILNAIGKIRTSKV